MKNFSDKFSQEDIKRIAEHPNTKQILQRLQQSDKSSLDSVAALAAQGKFKEAQEILQRLLDNKDTGGKNYG